MKSDYHKKYREENREKINKQKREHYKENRERIRQKHKEYREENREKINKQKRDYYKKNKEQIKKQVRKYREENREKIKKYREENREKIIEKKRKKYKENKDKIKEYYKKKTTKDRLSKWKKEYIKDDKVRTKTYSRNYARFHKLRDTKCAKCGSTKNLHFHHTNYEKNEGYTLCDKCHREEHKKMEQIKNKQKERKNV